MDASALAIALSRRLAELERWSSVLDSWLNRWTTIVVLGVVLELAFVIWEYRTELHDFRRGTIRSPEKPRLLKYIIEFLGAGLVAAGVAGELVVHTRSGKIETEMRDVTRQQVSIANDRAGDAIKEAARLTKEAEDERMARVKIEEAISWRTPDRGLIPNLAIPLQAFTGQRFAFVVDQEPERLNVISWLVILLSTSRWNAETARSSSELTFGATNIVLWVSPTAPDRVLAAAHALIPALERAGLPATVFQSGWGPQPDAAPPELIRVVIFKRGPRMIVEGNAVSFQDSPARMFFGQGPPH
jgi:hypothetical protein